MNQKAKRGITLVICLAVPLLVGALSGVLAGNIRAIYEGLNTPPLSPPGWLFGIVWPILYLLMGWASYLVVRDGTSKEKTGALALYVGQLAVNFSWSIIFFRADAFWVAFAVILLLDILVIGTMIAFRKINKLSFLLFLPYMVWISFATYLNLGTAWLN